MKYLSILLTIFLYQSHAYSQMVASEIEGGAEKKWYQTDDRIQGKGFNSAFYSQIPNTPISAGGFFSYYLLNESDFEGIDASDASLLEVGLAIKVAGSLSEKVSAFAKLKGVLYSQGDVTIKDFDEKADNIQRVSGNMEFETQGGTASLGLSYNFTKYFASYVEATYGFLMIKVNSIDATVSYADSSKEKVSINMDTDRTAFNSKAISLGAIYRL